MTLHKIDLSNFDNNFKGRSSYTNEKFSKVLRAICLVKNPTKIVEFGILDGYSLDCFIESTGENCQIDAYDLFEEFPYNSSEFNSINQKYKESRVSIMKGDLFFSGNELLDNSIDIIHVDIANDGDVYEYCIDNLIKKLKKDGVLILEGGSEERDNIEWMVKFNKRKIREVLYKYSDEYKIKVFNEFPSLTLISKK
jgi:predicted O-methyltransferase YrrM